MSRSKIKYWSILVFVLIVTASSHILPKNLVYADSDESTQIDVISIKLRIRNQLMRVKSFLNCLSMIKVQGEVEV